MLADDDSARGAEMPPVANLALAQVASSSERWDPEADWAEDTRRRARFAELREMAWRAGSENIAKKALQPGEAAAKRVEPTSARTDRAPIGDAMPSCRTRSRWLAGNDRGGGSRTRGPQIADGRHRRKKPGPSMRSQTAPTGRTLRAGLPG